MTTIEYIIAINLIILIFIIDYFIVMKITKDNKTKHNITK